MEGNMEKRLAVLTRLAALVNGEGIPWALGASGMLFLRGIASSFHDLDLMIRVEDASRVEVLLRTVGTLMPEKDSAGYGTKRFMEFVVDGVDVDVIAGFAIADGGRMHDCSFAPEQADAYATLGGERIPLHSLALWRRYYALMHRWDKVRMIDGAKRE